MIEQVIIEYVEIIKWNYSKKRNLLERVRGIEPLLSPWKGDVVPFNHTRTIRVVVYQIQVLETINYLREQQ